jgi:hypothetical protein
MQSIIKCTAAETCYFLADLSGINSANICHIQIDNSANFCISDYGNNMVYVLPISADISASTITSAVAAPLTSCTTGKVAGLAFNKDFSVIYISCAGGGNNIMKCSYPSGTCTSYVSSTAVIAYDNTNAPINLDFGNNVLNGGLVVDVDNDNILYASSSGNGYILNCTSQDACSPVLQRNSFSTTDDEKTSLHSPESLNQDAKGKHSYINISNNHYQSL